MSTGTLRPVAIKIDDDIKTRVKRLAKARNRTSHWLMREAINQYVDREEKREAFRQDALKAWEAYRATGRHVTAEEADHWLVQIEQGPMLIHPHATPNLVARSVARCTAPPLFVVREEHGHGETPGQGCSSRR